MSHRIITGIVYAKSAMVGHLPAKFVQETRNVARSPVRLDDPNRAPGKSSDGIERASIYVGGIECSIAYCTREGHVRKDGVRIPIAMGLFHVPLGTGLVIALTRDLSDIEGA